MSQNIFEKATRQRIRFNYNGTLTVEDVWDLPLESLNTLAKGLNKMVKEQGEEDFIKAKRKTKQEGLTELKFEIVKHIIDVKLVEQEEKELALEKKKKRERILELMEQKQNEALSQKSLDELKKELEELGA